MDGTGLGLWRIDITHPVSTDNVRNVRHPAVVVVDVKHRRRLTSRLLLWTLAQRLIRPWSDKHQDKKRDKNKASCRRFHKS